MVSVIIATQAREGIVTTKEQAERAYDIANKNTRNTIEEKQCKQS